MNWAEMIVHLTVFVLCMMLTYVMHRLLRKHEELRKVYEGKISGFRNQCDDHLAGMHANYQKEIKTIRGMVNEKFTHIPSFDHLSLEEQAFFVGAMSNKDDKALFLVLADWLEERDRMAEAERMRQRGLRPDSEGG